MAPEDGSPAPQAKSPAVGGSEKRENGKAAEATQAIIVTPKTRKEHRNSFFLREKWAISGSPSAAPSQASPCPSPSPSPSPILRNPAAALPKSSLSDGPSSSQLDEPTSDLGTMSSGASVPRGRARRWLSSSAGGLEPSFLAGGGSPGAAAGAEVSSITSDYSTTSSNTFLTAGESSLLSPEVGSVGGSRGGEEADDERSELISEGRPAETDSDSDFPVFASTGPSPAATSGAPPLSTSPEAISQQANQSTAGGSNTTPTGRSSLPSHRLIECDTLSRRRSLRQKTDSDSSVDGLIVSTSGGGGAGNLSGRGSKSSSLTSSSGKRLSRMLEVMKKGRSTGSLSSSSRSESERNTTTTATTTATNVPANTTPSSSSSSSSTANPSTSESAWRIRFTERFRLRLRGSADDVLGAASSSSSSSSQPQQQQQQRSRSPDPPRRSSRLRSRGLRRRHTMGGQRDFAQLQTMHDWSEQGGVACGAELTAIDRLRPKCSSQDFSIQDWIARERDGRGPAGPAGPQTDPTRDLSADADASTEQELGEQVNGGGPQAKSKAGLCVGGDAHPHKLSGAQVVRSRFYQYL